MGRLIYVAALNETTDKTLFAAHMATCLKETYKTALIDGTPQTHILENFIAKRYHFELKNTIDLPVPDYYEFKKEKLSSILEQYDFVVTDEPNFQFLRNAEKLFVIVSCQEALELSSSKSSFLNSVWEIKKQRAAEGNNTFRCVLILNQEANQEDYKKIVNNAKFIGFEIAPYTLQSDELKQSMQTGITLMDKNIPLLNQKMTQSDFFARRDLKKFLEYLWKQS